MAALLGVLQRNRDLLRNASSLAGTTGLTSVFGFVYWVVAAKSSAAGGRYRSAAVSAMTLLGTVGEFGLGTMLIGELPKAHRGGAGYFAATLLASGLGSLVLGLGFPLVASAFGGNSPRSAERPPGWRYSPPASR